MIGDIRLRPFAETDLDWLVEAHATLYAREAGFDASFGPLVETILQRFLLNHDSVRERGWVAEHDGHRLGSIFCVESPQPSWAKLRLFLVLPQARGFGLGQHLLDTCLGFARGVGYDGLTLWTHESHTAACALYEKNGFALEAEKPVTNFGCDLIEQTYKIAF
ncbi:GNAT family N-acetyltransferase [uncultured Shimia sp.]|uniref:GNAT family N-acetyltransferase n=1 Tax=uncultured Shimia sp. TaxID=573152 RepID=UPI002624F70E|nr:GNAT family N-acetyltransferase [uncultured Shimia sp.]